MELQLQNKRALVTGSSSGIGKRSLLPWLLKAQKLSYTDATNNGRVR
jgi:NAD(P)-dependent dehydrogenase (short-subunit alcohol dehydrogenase family)